MLLCSLRSWTRQAQICAPLAGLTVPTRDLLPSPPAARTRAALHTQRTHPTNLSLVTLYLGSILPFHHNRLASARHRSSAALTAPGCCIHRSQIAARSPLPIPSCHRAGRRRVSVCVTALGPGAVIPETANWRIPQPPAAIIRLAARPDSSGYCSLATITSSLDTCDTLSSPRTTQRTLFPRHIKRTISLFVLRHHKNTGGHSVTSHAPCAASDPARIALDNADLSGSSGFQQIRAVTPSNPKGPSPHLPPTEADSRVGRVTPPGLPRTPRQTALANWPVD